MSNAFAAIFGPQIRAWRGNAPLGVAFWGHGVFVSLVLIGAYLSALYRGDSPVQQAVLVLFLLYTGWVLAAIWRCAGPAREPWGMMARLLTVAWAMNALLVGGSLQLELLLRA